MACVSLTATMDGRNGQLTRNRVARATTATKREAALSRTLSLSLCLQRFPGISRETPTIPLHFFSSFSRDHQTWATVHNIQYKKCSFDVWNKYVFSSISWHRNHVCVVLVVFLLVPDRLNLVGYYHYYYYYG